jgi:hypothetical protein
MSTILIVSLAIAAASIGFVIGGRLGNRAADNIEAWLKAKGY